LVASLETKYDEPHSNFALNFNLRRYNTANEKEAVPIVRQRAAHQRVRRW